MLKRIMFGCYQQLVLYNIVIASSWSQLYIFHTQQYGSVSSSTPTTDSYHVTHCAVYPEM